MADPLTNNLAVTKPAGVSAVTPVGTPPVAPVIVPDNEQQADQPAHSELSSEPSDQFETPLSRTAMQARQMMQPGAELGHKVVYQQLPRREMQAPQSQRPAPQPKPDQFRQVAQDKMFQQSGMRDTPLYRHLQQRSLPQGQSRLSDQQLSQLIAMRHQADNKQAMRDVLRQEIREKKAEARKANENFQKSMTNAGGDIFTNQQGAFLAKVAGEAADESFEGILKKMMAGEKGLPNTPEGKSAHFAAKSNKGWEAMFSNLSKMGNVATEATIKAQQLMQSFFRGLYQQASKGTMLVSDLHYMSEAQQMMAEKFARILVNNPDMLKALEQLSPGDPIPEEILKTLGDEINFIQMAHVTETMTAEAKQQARDAAFATLRNPVNTAAQDRLSQKMKRSKNESDVGEDGFGHSSSDSEIPFKGQLFDPRWERQERFGKPKGWVFAVAALGAAMAMLLMYVIARNLFS